MRPSHIRAFVVDVPTRDEEKALLKEIPDRFVRTAQAYLVDGLSVRDIADEQGISERTVYDRLDLIARCTGRTIGRRSRRGRPRKVA